MAQQYKTYPIERMQPSSTPTSHPTITKAHKTQLTPHGQTTTTTLKHPLRSPSSTTNYKTKPNNTTPPNHSSRSNNPTSRQTKSASNKYIRGIVVVAPQNESTYGWIYSKTTNNMYQLPFSHKKRYIPDQIVLFNATSKLRGLKVTEARFLMSQNKLNINNYNNYFVSESVSSNTCHTSLYKLCEINNDYLTRDSESQSDKNKFVLNTFINLRSNNEIEFKIVNKNENKFPMNCMVCAMERYLNGFINASGGKIYFGIADDGRIYGQSLYGRNPRMILDEMQLKICEKLREWKPKKYIQKLMSSLSIDMVDIICIDDGECCGYVMPNKKIIVAQIETLYDCKGEQVIFSNNNCVYVRQLSSLCAYSDIKMEKQIGKRQINKLNSAQMDSDNSDIDFDDDDEKDWIHVQKLIKNGNGNHTDFHASYANAKKSIAKFVSFYTKYT